MKILSESLYDYLHQYTDLAYLLQEWDYAKNCEALESYTCFSSTKVWWLCPIGHSYDAIIRNRVKIKSGCPVCDNKRVLQGYNDLLSQCPEVAYEWDYTKNVLRPEEVIVTSHKNAWWKCSNNHSWEASIRKRTKLHQPSGCPFCSNKSILIGFNDLSTTHPELALEWDHDKNTRSIFSIGAGSGIKVWWKCRNHSNHSWQTSPVKRSGRGYGCPYCGNQTILIGFNDLATTHPQMLCEWDEDNTMLPTEVMAGSEVKVKWKCLQGHKWEAIVSSRVVYGTGCSQCKLIATSEIEILLRAYFKQHLDNVQTSHRIPTKIGKKNLYIDICGTFWVETLQ